MPTPGPLALGTALSDAVTRLMVCMVPETITTFVTCPEYLAWKAAPRDRAVALALIARLDELFTAQYTAAVDAIHAFDRALQAEGMPL